jgi:hypothetical protein
MTDELNQILRNDPEAKEYFATLPQYVKEAVDSNALQIKNAHEMRLFAESFMRDDSFRGA